MNQQVLQEINDARNQFIDALAELRTPEMRQQCQAIINSLEDLYFEQRCKAALTIEG